MSSSFWEIGLQSLVRVHYGDKFGEKALTSWSYTNGMYLNISLVNFYVQYFMALLFQSLNLLLRYILIEQNQLYIQIYPIYLSIEKDWLNKWI